MRSTIITSLFALGAAALPTAVPIDDSVLIERQFGGSSTSNDLVNGDCKPLVYIFARGTSETGNMGSTVGPAFADTLKTAFGSNNVAVQGVDYPADVAGAVTGATNPQGAQGSKKMASLVQQAASKCPSSKVVISGYSQGAEQVHGSLMNLSGSNNVAAAVTFGDPLQKSAFKNIDASKTKVFCAQGDSVCSGQFIITPAHLSYASTSVKPAADFVKSVVSI